MPQVDLPLTELERYMPAQTAAPDFDEFWRVTLTEAAAEASPAAFVTETSDLRLQVESVRFSGYGGDRIAGWLLRPLDAEAPLPCVVTFVGYGGGRGRPVTWTMLPSAGYAQFVMDTRGQGSKNQVGDTADPSGYGPHAAGFITQGVLDPHSTYYRRVYTDAVRAIETAAEHPAIDASRIAVLGSSQGGGIALAAAGLSPAVRAVIAEVPFLSHFSRAIRIATEGPYLEIAQYLATHRDSIQDVERTLSYMDAMNFASRAITPALFAVGLMDAVCPPSTVYAAYHHYAGPKELRIYPFNGHEHGGEAQLEARLDFLERTLGART